MNYIAAWHTCVHGMIYRDESRHMVQCSVRVCNAPQQRNNEPEDNILTQRRRSLSWDLLPDDLLEAPLQPFMSGEKKIYCSDIIVRTLILTFDDGVDRDR